jgi:hypothetical protein
MRAGKEYNWILLCVLVLFACRKPYIAPVQEQLNQFLVVDGLINASPGGISRFTLSYSKNLNDTTRLYPVNNADLRIEGTDGSIYYLQGVNDSGTYRSLPLQLLASNSYRLLIRTPDNRSYRSAFEPVRIAPPIDSITWEEQPDLAIFLYTSDPANQQQYYRWEFEETYQTSAQTPSFWTVVNGRIVEADASNQTASCWITDASKELLIGNAQQLSTAVVSKALIHTIPKPDRRLSIRYSMLVTQYAISPEAYRYYRLMKQNSEELGGIFDPLPSQLTGNIVSDLDPDEPVIGYIAVGQTTEKRIFLDKQELNNWPLITTGYDCQVINLPSNPTDYSIYDYPDPDYWFWYFSSGQPPGLVLSKKVCLDCRLSGGTNQKPSFW